MHVMVVLRLIPDTNEEFEIAESGCDIDREWIGFKLNEFDDHALEEAVLLSESTGAKVTAVALEGDGVDRLLQTALARGAQAVFKIPHELSAPVPVQASAPLFASAATELGCDLIFTGVQTPEDLYGQLAPALGGVLDWPQVSAVSGLKAEASQILVQQEYSGGFSAQLSVSLPAVVGIQAASKPPRYLSGTKLREVMSTKIAALAVSAEAPALRTEMLALEVPESTGSVSMLEGTAEAVADKLFGVLRDNGFLKG